MQVRDFEGWQGAFCTRLTKAVSHQAVMVVEIEGNGILPTTIRTSKTSSAESVHLVTKITLSMHVLEPRRVMGEGMRRVVKFA